MGDFIYNWVEHEFDASSSKGLVTIPQRRNVRDFIRRIRFLLIKRLFEWRKRVWLVNLTRSFDNDTNIFYAEDLKYLDAVELIDQVIS